MADLDPEIGRKLDTLIDLMRSAYSGGGGIGVTSSAGKAKKDTDAFASSVRNAQSQLKELNKLYKLEEISISDLSWRLKDQSKILRHQIRQQEEQADQLKKASKFEEERLLREKINAAKATQYELDRNRIVKESSDSVSKGLKEFSNNLVMSGAKMAGELITSIQAGTNPIATANKVLTTGLTVASGGLDKFSGFAETTGASIMQMGGKARLAGGALMALGMVAGGLSKGLEVAKFAVEVLGKEYETVAKSFVDMSKSGAMFADGMEGMVHAAGNSGLTLQQFSTVVQKSSDALASTGLGVTDAAKRMGEVGKVLKTSGVSRELLKLGYSLEEQAELTAEVMSNMTRLGGKASNQEIANATKDYAQNLRMISAITGEDAKKKAETVKQENMILAFQQKKAQMSPKQQAEIEAAMSQMTEVERKNFRERMVLGTVINKEGALFEATVPGMREKAEESARLAASNNLTAAKQAEINQRTNARYGEQILKSNESIGIAAIGGSQIAGSMAKNQLEAYNLNRRFSKESLANAKDNVKGQRDARGLTDEYAKSVEALQDAQVAIQEIAIDNMGYYASKVAEINEFIATQLEKMKGTSFADSLKDSMMSILGVMGGVLATAVISKLLGGLGGKITGGLGGLFGKPIPPLPGGGPAGGVGGSGGPKTPSPTVARALELRKENPGMSREAALATARKEIEPKVMPAAASEAKIAGKTATAPVGSTAAGTAVAPSPTTGAGNVAKGTSAAAGAKAAGKGLARFIPGVGLVLGGVEALHRAKEGDFAGAALAGGAGLASLIPGVGTAVGLGLTGALAAKDMLSPATPAAEAAKTTELAQSAVTDLLNKLVDQGKITNSALDKLTGKIEESLNYHKQVAQNTA